VEVHELHELLPAADLPPVMFRLDPDDGYEREDDEEPTPRGVAAWVAPVALYGDPRYVPWSAPKRWRTFAWSSRRMFAETRREYRPARGPARTLVRRAPRTTRRRRTSRVAARSSEPGEPSEGVGPAPRGGAR
jgi:hypothetical protein